VHAYFTERHFATSLFHHYDSAESIAVVTHRVELIFERGKSGKADSS
jgi:hypothetical protein